MAHSHNKAPRSGPGVQPWFAAKNSRTKKKRKLTKQARRKNR